MGVFDTIGNAISDGADAIVGGAEAVVEAVDEAFSEGGEAIDEGMEAVGQWFIDELVDAGIDFINDGGSEVDSDPIEERAEQGSIKSPLDVAQAIPFEPAREYGFDNDELTLLPSRFDSRFSAADDGELQLDAVRLATDGAIGTVDDITTETHFGTSRSPDRSEDHDGESEPHRSPHRGESHEPSGGAASETRDDSGETLAEARNDGNATERTWPTQPDALRFVAATDTTGSETLTGADSAREGATTHTPEWTNFNDADPSITLADGGWMRDADFRPHDDDRSSRREGGAFSVETETQYTGFATTLEDASPTLSWLH
jgi:hypothetical protein